MEKQLLMNGLHSHLAASDTHTANKPVVDMSVILVCWNNKSYLEACLQSLYEGNLSSRFDVVVVDNGSTDGSQAMLREKFPEVQLIQNDHNVGLGKASNQGIEATQGRYVLLLNNDTLVNGASLDAMVALLDTMPTAGAVGGRLLNPDGSFQAGFANFSTLREEFLIATHLGELLWPGYPSHIDDRQVRTVGWLSSACLLVRRAALDQVGLLDESYFIYGDEADLQYRLQRAGWQVYYLPNAYTIHYGGRSMNRWSRRKMVYRGKLLFYQKNYGPFRTGILRTLLGGISLTKMAPWIVAWPVPIWRERAQKELRSNLDVVKLCLKLG
ncbi:MAG: glycosyltransferase family 2 protein [Chloroflexi bacterium]|nr:MAG: glycosyltransferase family 2 protein [Chloroflexota bacterium]